MINNIDDFKYTVNSDDPNVRRESIGHELSDAVLREVLQDGEVHLLIVCIRNKKIPLWFLGQLATHPDDNVRAEVASKRKLTATLQEVLAVDRSVLVRTTLAHNQSVSETTLSRLREDGEESVRAASRRL